MKRSLQEIVELVVFALVALLVLTGVLWFTGWLVGLLGMVFIWAAGLLWSLLRWLVPIAIIIAAVYALVRLLQRQSQRAAAPSVTSANPDAATTGDAAPAPAAAPVTTIDASGEPVDPAADIAASTPAGDPASSAAAVDASGEPVPTVDAEPVTEAPADVATGNVPESGEPVATVDAELVEDKPADGQDGEGEAAKDETQEKEKKD
ncbi:hypothetical protein [Truepera radiovictrix]|uniref:Uncharacterized protein n=1 Tax=Truepera radiovictrix (strain DSM 17093 / CIP 108686 / LMG 22925 / RQ-24) TaxID=649638 RepID=D7CRV1_TRURR|nr:hypothetical protein [Truepera radiovictrix]ADI15279.1 hypothetical protein Trad_2166 [Truepera radiovictrix DSM 17093]WMT56170.1 hypothetical protein RCV51_09130 [Truepera radiovictrix]